MPSTWLKGKKCGNYCAMVSKWWEWWSSGDIHVWIASSSVSFSLPYLYDNCGKSNEDQYPEPTNHKNLEIDNAGFYG